MEVPFRLRRPLAPPAPYCPSQRLSPRSRLFTMRRFQCLSILFLLAAAFPSLSFSAGLFPWQFGMSKVEVESFNDFGPYKTFQNGDLETYAGVFHGRKENVQFYFDDTGLFRITICFYEGIDLTAAKAKWLEAYETLQSMYGEIETPGFGSGLPCMPVGTAALATAARDGVRAGRKMQMAPVKQPGDLFVFSGFNSLDIMGTTYYQVTIFLNPAPNNRL